MSVFDVNMPDFLSKLVLSENDMLEIVEAVTPIAKEEIKNALSKYNDTGQMANSVTARKPTRTKNGDYISVIGPSGKDSNGVRNIEKAVYLNYGTATQPAKPWLAQTINNIKPRVDEELELLFNERLNKK